MVEQIYPTAPFDLTQILQRPLSRPSILSVINKEATSYLSSIRLGKRATPFKAVWSGTVDTPKLDIYLTNNLTEDERREAVNTIRTIFLVDCDMTGFIKQFSKEETWSTLIHKFYGLRPVLHTSLFEAMVKVIIGQQVNVKMAAILIDRLVLLCGETVEWQGKILPAFPSPERVAGLSYEQLRKISFSQRKAEYVIDFARTVANGELNLNKFWSMTEEDVFERLANIRGIGRWTVECFLIFGMGRPDVIPASDIGIQNAVKKLYNLPKRPNESQLREMATEWAPWRSYAAYYLWNSLI